MTKGCCANRMGDFVRQLRPRLEHVAVARDQLAAMSADVRQRAEAVEFRLEQKIGMIERLRNPQQPHGEAQRHGEGSDLTKRRDPEACVCPRSLTHVPEPVDLERSGTLVVCVSAYSG